MNFDQHKNLAQSLLAAVPVDRVNGTEFKVLPGTGELFAASMPVTLAPYGKDPTFYNSEIGYIAAVLGDNLTINRRREESMPQAVQVGWVIAGTVTAGTLEAIEDAVLTKADQTYVDELVDGLDLRGDVRTVAGRAGNVVLAKADVGLNLVDNTSDAAKPVSAPVQTALNAKYNASNPAGYVDAFQAGASAPVQSVAGKQGAVTLAKGDVGLSNVDNTSDASKPVSTAVSSALATKAPLASPEFSGRSVFASNNTDFGTNDTNRLTIGNEGQTDSVWLDAFGTATDITLKLRSKGAGNIRAYNPVQLPGDPTFALAAAPKQYVDARVIAGVVKTADVVIGNSNADIIVGPSTDISAIVNGAIAGLTASRTWSQTIYLRGNFLIDNEIIVPSFTTIILDGTITTTTLRPSGASNWVDHRGVFRIGRLAGAQVVTQASIYFTPGSKVIGDHFGVNNELYPQNIANLAFATDPSIANQKGVAVVASYCAMIDCDLINIFGEGLADAIHLEGLGSVNGTPSRGNRILNAKGRYMIVAVEVYVNGWQSDSISILNTFGEYCIDDIVAVVGSAGGKAGAPGIMKNFVVDGIWGNKNGLRGAAIKVDGGETALGGLGQISHGLVTNVNVTTASATLAGVVQAESVAQAPNTGSLSSRNLSFTNIRAVGNWRHGIRHQTSGADINYDNIYIEALYGFIATSPVVPDPRQKISMSNATFVERNGSNGETGSHGIVFNAGSSTQGYQNITLRNVRAQYFAVPLGEVGISGLGGSAGTINNVDYEIDVMASPLSTLNFSSTNRRLTVKQFGQIVRQDNGGVILHNVATGVDSTDAANVGQLPTTLAPTGPAGGDLAGTYPNPTVPGLASKAADNLAAHLADAETFSGPKTFEKPVILANTPADLTNKLVSLVALAYNIANRMTTVISTLNNSTDNRVVVGGGKTGENAATRVSLYTAGNNNVESGSERVRVNAAGFTYFGGSVDATSTAQVGGSFATKVNAVSAATTLDATHCSVELNTTATQTLPALATCQGRMYEFVNINAAAATIKGSGAELIGNVTTANTYTLASGSAVTLKAFPSAWRVI